MTKYPIGEHMDVVSKTGKRQSEITVDAIKRGEISPEDIKISQETLIQQGKVARENGRPHLGQNFERAAELTSIPDEMLLEIYGKLRPHRSTKDELLQIADSLKSRYNAPLTAKLVSDAAAVYEKRGVLV